MNTTPLTKHLIASGVFHEDKFCLADVGASGGIHERWNVFGDDLIAHGFEPLIGEAERLNKSTGSPNIRYHPVLVGYRRYEEMFPGAARVPDNQPFPRTSAVRALELTNCNYAATHYDGTGTAQYAAELIELDQFFDRQGVDPDFIKVDTDGHDYPVLLGAQRLLREKAVLGLSVESQFHGPLHPHSNLFANIDTLLRSCGFSLFDLEVYRYSRAVLPKPFVYKLQAQTVQGQVVWGEALYLRDAGFAGYEDTWPVPLTGTKLLKLICLFEIYGLEDCSAEVLLKYRDRLARYVDVDFCLDLITPRFRNQTLPYRDYISIFERNPESFYPAGDLEPQPEKAPAGTDSSGSVIRS